MQGFMKFLGSVLVWASLSVGAVSAATSYIVPVAPAAGNADWFRASREARGADDPSIGPGGYLKTTAVAGPEVAKDGALKPLFPAGTELTPATVEAMIGADASDPVVDRVKVASWSFERWSSKWWFFGACGGLIAGGLLVRFSGSVGAASDDAGVDESTTPSGAMAAAVATLRGLKANAPRSEDVGEALRLVNDELEELRQSHLANFANARAWLIGRYGLGGFAAIMDRFAEGERAVNRAWSAAADGRVGNAEDAPDMLAEAMEACVNAEAAFSETLTRLG